MGTYNEIFCDNRAEFAIEHLFKAIHILQDLPGCEEEVAALSRKLEQEFAKIPAKGDVKKSPSSSKPIYVYNSNGVVHPQDHRGIRILLSSWEPEEKQKLVESKLDYGFVREYFHPAWYYQLCEYIGRKYSVSRRFKLDKLEKQYNTALALPEDAQELVSIDSIEGQIKYEKHGATRFFQFHNGWSRLPYRESTDEFMKYHYLVPFFFLDEEELKLLDKMVHDLSESDKRWEFGKEIFHGIVKSKKPNRVYIDLNPAYKIEQRRKVKWDFRKGYIETDEMENVYTFDHSKAADILFATLPKITDPIAKKVIKRLGLAI